MSGLPNLAESEVHLWQATLAVEPVELTRFAELLSPDESARAKRLIDPLARDRFIAGRGLLRTIIGRYLESPPAEIRLVYGEQGKPSLAGEEQHGLSFNLSHAGDLFLLAVARHRNVGIDLELMQEDLPFREMAGRYFASRERTELFALPPDAQLSAFYRCWTRKEAYLKGCGSGFSHPSDSFAVSLLPDQPPTLIEHRALPEEPARWYLTDLPVPLGYCAALAMTGGRPSLRSLS